MLHVLVKAGQVVVGTIAGVVFAELCDKVEKEVHKVIEAKKAES